MALKQCRLKKWEKKAEAKKKRERNTNNNKLTGF